MRFLFTIAISSEGTLTYITVFLRMMSRIAADAGAPCRSSIGAAAFTTHAGSHPLAGMAGASPASPTVSV